MCGRYASSRSTDDIVEEFEVLDPRLEQPIAPSWNVAPTDEVHAVMARVPRTEGDPGRTGEPVRQLRALRWGLVPSWAKDEKIGARMINARIETAAQKPAFRKAFAARRCILPADGYYEWYVLAGQEGKTRPAKQPFFIRPDDDSVLAMAGLYEIWRDPSKPEDADDRFRWTCTVLTTEATDELGRIHDRMPLVVGREQRTAWLDPRTPVEDLSTLLAPAQQSGLRAYPVSTAVGNVRNNGPQLVAPLAPEGTGNDSDDEETLL